MKDVMITKYGTRLKAARAKKREYANFTIPKALREDVEFMKEHQEFVTQLNAEIELCKNEIEKAGRRLTRGIFEEETE